MPLKGKAFNFDKFAEFMVEAADYVEKLLDWLAWVICWELLVDARREILPTVLHVLHSVDAAALIDVETTGT